MIKAVATVWMAIVSNAKQLMSWIKSQSNVKRRKASQTDYTDQEISRRFVIFEGNLHCLAICLVKSLEMNSKLQLFFKKGKGNVNV